MQQVLEIGCGACCGADRDLVEKAVTKGEHSERRDPRPQLEPPVGEVLMRHAIAGDVYERPKRDSPAPRGGESARDRAGGDVQRDDHLCRGMISKAAILAGRSASVAIPARP
jgi:hypothetical protein